jgi:hypothetical protein
MAATQQQVVQAPELPSLLLSPCKSAHSANVQQQAAAAAAAAVQSVAAEGQQVVQHKDILGPLTQYAECKVLHSIVAAAVI